MLYVPRHFRHDDPAAALRLIAEHPFATLVTPGAPEPHVTHLPLVHVADGGSFGSLLGHFAAANPHAAGCSNAVSLAIFQGPHAYVSPTQYVEPAKAVPTWNYAVVHVHGEVQPAADSRTTRGILDILTERFERSREAPWQLALDDTALRGMLGAIVAFRMPIARLEAKFKLSQNRSVADRLKVAATLASSVDPDARGIAALMQRHGAADEQG